jgi:hypothetical protein
VFGAKIKINNKSTVLKMGMSLNLDKHMLYSQLGRSPTNPFSMMNIGNKRGKW